MISTRHLIASMLVAAAVPVALVIASSPAVAKKGGGGGGKWVEVGPIWNQSDAENKCPKAARRQGMTWSGQWKTTIPGKMSKCQLKYGSSGSGRRMIEVGPIWNQADAEVKCPKAARKAGGYWTGQWRTTRQGIMSECEIKPGHATGLLPEPKKNKGAKWMVEVGPIWNQTDAELKCLRAAREAGAQWTGQWKTTRVGQMSVCELKR